MDACGVLVQCTIICGQQHGEQNIHAVTSCTFKLHGPKILCNIKHINKLTINDFVLCIGASMNFKV